MHHPRDEKITLGITTLLSMSILICMVADKLPSTSSFIPIIGWFYTSMMLLISLSTLAASFVIYVQKCGILGKRPPSTLMFWGLKIGIFFNLKMPLLMKQAYFRKAAFNKSLTLRHKEKVGRIHQSPSRRPSRPVSYQSTIRVSTVEEYLRRKSDGSLRNSVEPTSTHRVYDRDQFLENDRSFNVGHSWADEGFDEHQDDHLSESILGHNLTKPHRNLAEIEFDWLAAVIERAFLIVFTILFFLLSFGINGIGFYYWYFAIIG